MTGTRTRPLPPSGGFMNSPNQNCPKLSPFQETAAVAKSLQSCPTLCDPINGSPSGSPVPRILQARARRKLLSWSIYFEKGGKPQVEAQKAIYIHMRQEAQTLEGS